MEDKLFKLIDGEIPDLNRSITDGFAVREMLKVESYIDDIIRCAEGDFPAGLRYVDYRRLNPLEEFEKATEPRSSKSQYDFARNDVYMALYEFEYNGERILKPIYLPFVRDGGLTIIRGSTFAISPVLADKGISLGVDFAFVQIPKAKITVGRTTHSFKANGLHRAPYVAHSRLHNRDRKQARKNGQPPVNMETSLIHYLFAKYGVVETFKRFLGTKIIIGSENEVNEDRYPPDNWVVCHSVGLKPRGVKGRIYNPSTLRVAIPFCDFDDIAEAMIGGLFYVVDHFPNRVQPDYLDGGPDETRLWRILLGLVIGGVSGGEGRIAEDIDEHMDSLDSYIDARAKTELAQGDIYVDNIYQLLMHILEVITHTVLQPPDEITTMYDKRLMILRYVLRDINDDIFRMLFRLKSAATKKDLTFKDVHDTIRRRISTDAVLRMNNSGMHGEVNSVSSPGDNKFFKVTSSLVLQTDSGASSKSGKSGKNDPSKLLHASIAEVGSYTVLPKSEPTGRTRVNPWVQIDDYGSVIRDNSKKDLIDRTQHKIKRK